MRRAILLVAALVAVSVAAAGTAEALRIRVGDIVIVANGGFSPKRLPRKHDAPIEIHGGGRVSTVSGELPPVLETLSIEFDRHGSLQTAGLPVCTVAKLTATTVEAARRMCPGAIVGKGVGHAAVAFPEQKPISVTSPITLFNGPRKHGDATVIAHAYTTVPAPTTFIVPIVIERIHKGVYGYRVQARIPEIAGGYGVPLSGSLEIGRRWTYRGRRHSYVNARCETGALHTRGAFKFKNGDFLKGSFVLPCKPRS